MNLNYDVAGYAIATGAAVVAVALFAIPARAFIREYTDPAARQPAVKQMFRAAARLVRAIQRRLARRSFGRSASWWVESHGVKRLSRHRLGWRAEVVRFVRRWMPVVAWGARRELAAIGVWRTRMVLALAEFRYGQWATA